MEDRDFDIIIVGSGCAGATAAFVAATSGKSVLVVERGDYAGAKNMTGGRIYTHSLRKVFPDFESEAPLERKIVHERIAMLDSESQTTLDFTSPELSAKGAESYSVLRADFDQWLASKAEDAGAEYICGIPVEELVKDDSGYVIGIKAGDDVLTSHVVILAEGVNSLLSERYLGNPRPKPNQMAVGIKELFELSPDQIEQRFLCQPGEGAAMLFVGDCTKGRVGGGFLYTNKESVSLGLVATISDAASASNPVPIYQMLDDFKKHPAVAPMIAGAKMIEHSGHMVSEGGFDMIPRYVFDGALVAGDSAMLCMNLGYQVRGMDFAIASGQMAAMAACTAIDSEDVSAKGLSTYKTMMENSFVIQDLQKFRGWPSTMENWNQMFTDYPKMARELLNSMFVVDGRPQQHLKDRMKPIIKRRGLHNLYKQAKGALKSL
ncbi:MAG: FAD-dependent oxidoreductase [Coriobacteriales bacterium]|jgi:electron transfer flavoprotein-quinone oxidoreductase